MGSRVYIGRLPYHAREKDVERFFRGYGRIREINLKNGFGFVEFDDPRDADDAVYELNGKELCGERVSVEHARGIPRGSGGRFMYPPPGRDRYGHHYSYLLNLEPGSHSNASHSSDVIYLFLTVPLPTHAMVPGPPIGEFHPEPWSYHCQTSANPLSTAFSHFGLNAPSSRDTRQSVLYPVFLRGKTSFLLKYIIPHSKTLSRLRPKLLKMRKLLKHTKVPEPYKHEKTVSGQWKGSSAGGCGNNPATYPNNPVFQFTLQNSANNNHVLLELKGPKQYSVGFDVKTVTLTGDAESPGAFQRAASGDFRHGYCVLELENVPGGTYNLTPCTFRAGQEGPFLLTVSSSCPFTVAQIK